ncbi:hypothetical protein [Butyrivibrio sp. VCD2006]|uniref:hypothetical protein n=1 Tax=Butyrivibrio sp. VCD2006 TaxID=1280664 RepID=UPI00040B6390|nr:hypothetical protein [Butyrivibrio sp. VCD2006]
MKTKTLSIILTGIMALSLAGCGATTTFTEQSADDTVAAEQATEDIVEDDTAKSDTPDFSNVFSTKYFEITIPDNIADLATVETSDDRIDIYDKESKDAGFGGLIVSLWAVPVPKEYAGGPYVKIGELSDKNNNTCEMIRGSATEIQWDYNIEEMPENFKKVNDSVDAIIASIIGINGYDYNEGAGMKGADLYGDVLEKYVTAVNEDWDANKYEAEDMSPQFVEVTAAADDKLSAIGYAYADINCDGIDELFLGEIADGDFKGVVYDVYTMVDGAPAHVISGTARNRYFNYDNDFLVNEWSGGADESGTDLLALMNNDTELVYQVGYKYDGYTDEKNPWYRSYDGQEYEQIDEAAFKSSTDEFAAGYVRFDYTPLSER